MHPKTLKFLLTFTISPSSLKKLPFSIIALIKFKVSSEVKLISSNKIQSPFLIASVKIPSLYTNGRLFFNRLIALLASSLLRHFDKIHI
ncbi:hypothetical protein A0H76_2532 [Hepatospora eriocheir]|uniref:Uncharacterized protein n=1 Tax=Hepatospora eriocheir TaxID=1081669 RepID=A0A1X0QF55_9MICR|nr:hypothetical protein A0H76_2532 [Hepatospora eriocheir]